MPTLKNETLTRCIRQFCLVILCKLIAVCKQNRTHTTIVSKHIKTCHPASTSHYNKGIWMGLLMGRLDS